MATILPIMRRCRRKRRARSSGHEILIYLLTILVHLDHAVRQYQQVMRCLATASMELKRKSTIRIFRILCYHETHATLIHVSVFPYLHFWPPTRHCPSCCSLVLSSWLQSPRKSNKMLEGPSKYRIDFTHTRHTLSQLSLTCVLSTLENI